MITCILLCAGLSERFGSPKALAMIKDLTVIERLQKTLLQSPCEMIIVVLGAEAQRIQPSIFIHSRIRVVYNKNYFFGQVSSVQAGVAQADHASQGYMFLPVDCPFIQTSTIETITEHFTKNDPEVLIPTYQNKKGHPPIFHQRLRAKILELSRETGLNSLFAQHPPETIEINDPGIVKSFNTPEELKEITSKL